MALFPGGWSRVLWWYDLLGLLRPSSCVFQMLLSKYNQQYHKLFKDIPLEEVVLKGELPPWVGGQAILQCPKPRASPPRTSRHKFSHGNWLPFEVVGLFFFRSVRRLG